MHDGCGPSYNICKVRFFSCLLIEKFCPHFFLLPDFYKVSAAVSSSGELMFLSEPNLSDTEPELTDAR